MKKQHVFKLSAIILALSLLFSISTSAFAAEYTGVNGATVAGGVTFVSDWGQKATSKNTVALDGLSVTFDAPALGEGYSMLGFGLTKGADGVGLGGSGDGVMFRMMYTGSDYADVMPMNIGNWWDTNAPEGTAWVHNGYLGAGLWGSYTFTINKNGDNYDFKVNDIAVASVPTADVEALAGTTPYITFYMWNNLGGSTVISDISGVAPSAADYNLSGSTMTDNGVVIKADWMQRVKYSEKMYLDGLSIKIVDASFANFGMIGFGFAKDEAGVDLAGSGDGVLFKMMYTGSDYADVMPMNIANWWDVDAPAGTAWVHNGYLGAGVWESYTFTINKNGDNYDFKVNDIAVASVPAADVEALINEDGSAYMSFYSWNGINTYTVAEIINGAAPQPDVPVCEHEYTYACDAHCAKCGELTNENAAHSVKHVDAKAPTCEEPGNIEYWYCEYCGAAWSDEALTQVTNQKSVVVPIAHNVIHVEAKAATTEEMGNIEYWYCDACGAAWLDEQCHLNTNLQAVKLPVVSAEPESPATGDNLFGLYTAMIVVAMTALAAVALRNKKTA